MTCREKLKLEHPEEVTEQWVGGCFGCPDSDTRKYIETEQTLCRGTRISSCEKCTECWDTEIPDTEPTTQEPDTAPSESTEQKTSIPSMTDLQQLMRKALGYPGVAVSITFMEDVITFNAYPYPIQDESEGEDK